MTRTHTTDGDRRRLQRELRAHLEIERTLGQDALPRAGLEPPEVRDEPSPEGPSADFLARRAAEIADCKLCKLCEGRTQVVYGVGNPQADLMFVGEAPGRDEDRQGEPFVGRAGQLLTKIIKVMGYERSDVYITNINKCRPPDNRLPQPDEVRACLPFLEEQIQHIQPRVLVCLGKLSSNIILETGAAMGALRGRFHERNGVQIMPTYHPAYLLRNPADKRKVWDDMQKVMALLAEDT